MIILIAKLNEKFKNSKSLRQTEQTTEELEICGKRDWFNSVRLHHDMLLSYQQKAGVLSGVGFEPTPTRVDCDLNAAP